MSDDVVIAQQWAKGVPMGSGAEPARHFMKIGGLDIVDVREMFGVWAIRQPKRLEVTARMHAWDEDEEYTRIDMEDDFESVLDVELPLVKLPIIPGKNVTVICEVIAMNHLLRHYRYDSAKVFKSQLAEQIKRGIALVRLRRGIEWFEHDFE